MSQGMVKQMQLVNRNFLLVLWTKERFVYLELFLCPTEPPC